MLTVEVVWRGERYRITYCTRDWWGGGPVRKGHSVSPTQFIGWFLHHTVMVMADYDRDGHLHGDLDDVKRYMQMLQVARPDLGSEVPYSWVIFRGEDDHHVIICEGRGRGRTGAHTSGFNSTFYAWALAGNFENETVSPGMIVGMRWLAARETPKAHATTRPHRSVFATACPGRKALGPLVELQPPFNDIGSPSTATEEYVMATRAEVQSDIAAALTKFFGEHGTDMLTLAVNVENMEAPVHALRFNDGTIVTQASISVPAKDAKGRDIMVNKLALQYHTDPELIDTLRRNGVLPDPIPTVSAADEAVLRRLPVILGS